MDAPVFIHGFQYRVRINRHYSSFNIPCFKRLIGKNCKCKKLDGFVRYCSSHLQQLLTNSEYPIRWLSFLLKNNYTEIFWVGGPNSWVDFTTIIRKFGITPNEILQKGITAIEIFTNIPRDCNSGVKRLRYFLNKRSYPNFLDETRSTCREHDKEYLLKGYLEPTTLPGLERLCCQPSYQLKIYRIPASAKYPSKIEIRAVSARGQSFTEPDLKIIVRHIAGFILAACEAMAFEPQGLYGRQLGIPYKFEHEKRGTGVKSLEKKAVFGAESVCHTLRRWNNGCLDWEILRAFFGLAMCRPLPSEDFSRWARKGNWLKRLGRGKYQPRRYPVNEVCVRRLQTVAAGMRKPFDEHFLEKYLSGDAPMTL